MFVVFFFFLPPKSAHLEFRENNKKQMPSLFFFFFSFLRRRKIVSCSSPSRWKTIEKRFEKQHRRHIIKKNCQKMKFVLTGRRYLIWIYNNLFIYLFIFLNEHYVQSKTKEFIYLFIFFSIVFVVGGVIRSRTTVGHARSFPIPAEELTFCH